MNVTPRNFVMGHIAVMLPGHSESFSTSKSIVPLVYASDAPANPLPDLLASTASNASRRHDSNLLGSMPPCRSSNLLATVVVYIMLAFHVA